MHCTLYNSTYSYIWTIDMQINIFVFKKNFWPQCILVDWLLYGNYWRLIEILPCVEGNLYIFTRYHYKKTEKLDRSEECYILLSPSSLRVLKVQQVKIIRMSHWRHTMVDGVRFWITCKRNLCQTKHNCEFYHSKIEK